MQNILIFIILGVVQGLTEPLPISSSGHLLIFQSLFNFNIPGMSFEAFVNFGSTIAIIYFFKDKLIEIIFGVIAYFIAFIKKTKALKKDKVKFQNIQKRFSFEWDYFLKIVVASIPLPIIGILLLLLGYKDVESIKVVGIALLFTALCLFLVSRISGTKSVEKITYKDALIIGVFQGIALVPGISRSGMTLVGGLLVGVDKKEAFNFSFLMFIPASVLALLFSLIDIVTSKDITQYLVGYILSFILAGIFTWIGLKILDKVVIANKLYYFAIYCLCMGIFVTLFLK